MRFYLVVCVLIIGFHVEGQYQDIEEPHRLGGSVNSIAAEIAPVFSKESKTLYYTRMNDPESIGGMNDQDIWSSEWNGEKIYAQGTDYKSLNNKLNNSIVGFNTDESTVYLMNSYEGKKDMKKGISFANKKGSGWGSPKEIVISGLDIEGDFYGFHVNKAGDAILISYDGPNSLGSEDLYVSTLKNDSWSSPMHLGPTINSSGFEMSPFLSENSDTLYFSTDGRGGEGEADIFYSVRTSSLWTDWSTPINLGSKINSPKFDAYFTISEGFFYWSSNRDSERSDIYYSSFLPPPPLMASATGKDVTVFAGSDGFINLTPKGGVAPYSYLWSNDATVEDPQGLVKGIYSAIVTDAIGQTTTLEVEISEPADLIIPEPVRVEEVVEVVENIPLQEAIIYFDLNSSYHNAKNRKELKLFCSSIANKKEAKIMVVSHCDKRDSDAYNIWLSKKRMERTKAFLVAQGFVSNSIDGTFKGESQLKINCEDCTEENHTLNRRTVIKVLK